MLEQEGQHSTTREDEIAEMLILAARLKEAHGGELDDSAIDAVSEATGTPVEYVRLALNSVQTKQTPIQRIRNGILTLDPDVRRYVTCSWLAAIAGLCTATAKTFGDRSSILGIITMLLVLGAVWNCTRAKDVRVASLSGAIFGGLWFILSAAFLAIISIFLTTPAGASPFLMFAYIAGGALAGGLSKGLLSRNLSKLGLRDPVEDRQELLQQLVDLQDKLRSGEQSLSFLSLDIVGSTKMKQVSDPLSVEFTFNEYHRYVETIVRKHGGNIHSTAGDGITCAFDSPQEAFVAARSIQSGLFELNTHRNKLGMPIRLRAAIHHGTVLAPDSNVQNVNFAHVIDIAAHLQKVCPEGCVAVSETAAKLVSGGAGAIGADIVTAQEVSAFVWKPKLRVEAFALPGAHTEG